jgi:hypothetical protein
MGSTVAAQRSRLHNEGYVALRAKIIAHYKTLPLMGREAGAKAYKLPPKLGHWHDTHSALVLSVCPELDDVVRAIDELRAQRDADAIAAQHIRRKPGGRGSNISHQTPELVGEWPPRQ